MSKSTPTALFILDGLAHNPNPRGNAVHSAATPVLDRLWSSCPYTELVTFGPSVGLPQGQMGNSEVGHLNIGGGRIVKQELTLINEAVGSGRLDSNSELEALCLKAAAASGAIHLVGLVSNGGVHSSSRHVVALAEACLKHKLKKVYLHAVTDGRDRPPRAGKDEVGEVAEALQSLAERFGADVRIVSVVGRYYAMDRDNRWERTQRAYDLFTAGAGTPVLELEQVFDRSYAAGITDEFIEPHLAAGDSETSSTRINDGDVLLFANFRADRMRQIVRAFFDEAFSGFSRKVWPRLAAIAGLTEYDDDFPVGALFRPQEIKNHFGEVVAAAGLHQLRVAETEKYPHVTYFFNGGVEDPCKNEARILVPSPRDVKTYDLKPQMSAPEVTDELVRAIESGRFSAFVVNYANCDMVGHTGNFDAAVQAVQTVDTCLGRALSALEKQGGAAVVTSDHGNADQMIDYETGQPHTYHTKHPVPFSLVGAEFSGLKLRENGALCDIAPTLCEIMQLPQPTEMTGRSLIK